MKTSASGKCLERLDMLVIHFASQRHPRSFSRTPVDLSIAWLETVEGFPAAVESRYPVDISKKISILSFPYGFRLLQYVIKSEAEEFKLPRTQAGL